MNLLRRLLNAGLSRHQSTLTAPAASQAGSEEDWQVPYKLAKRLLSIPPPLSADDYLWPERDELLQELIGLGQRAAPAIEAAIDAGLRSPTSAFEYENMGLLCEALGRVGGPRALDTLAAITVQPSNIFEFRHLREGAIRGLGHLEVPGVVSLLKRLERQIPGLSHVIVPSLRQQGIEVESVDPSDVRWHVGATTSKEIREAFINFELEKTRPDYASLREKAKALRSEEKHGVWLWVGDALRRKGNISTASQCYVEAMAADSSSDFGTWRFIELPPGSNQSDRLRRELEEVMNRPDGDSLERKKRLISDLRTALGSPGECVESSNNA